MKIIFYLYIFLAVTFPSAAFPEEQLRQDSVVLFSDTDFDVPHIYHTVDILGFILGSDSIAYSVVKIREYPSRNISYRLFVTKGNVSRSFEFTKLSGLEYLILGKMGFDDKGNLNIPMLTQKSGIHLHMYKAYPDKLVYIENWVINKSVNIIGAMYDDNVLFVNDRLGRVSFIEANQEIKTIEGIKVESIKDVRRFDDDLYFIATIRNKNSLDVSLIHSKMEDYKQYSIIKLEIKKEDANSNFKIEFLSKGKLVLSKNPISMPAFNPTSALIMVDLDTKKVDYKFYKETAKSVIAVGVTCSGDVLIPVAAYGLSEDVAEDLMIKYRGKQKLINQIGNRLFNGLKIQTINGDVYVLSNYKYLVGKIIYSELSLIHAGIDGYKACVVGDP